MKFTDKLFGLKTLKIFKNKKYNYQYSVKHRGQYLYINPTQFGGAGLSDRMDMCASHYSIEDCKEMICKWIAMYYNDDIENYNIIECGGIKNKIMKTIIGNEIGMIIGSFISLLWLEPKQVIGVFIIMNLGYWMRYMMEERGAIFDNE